MSLKDRLYEAAKTAVDRGDAAGVNAIVIQNGEEKAYLDCGMRDIENNKPMTRDTIFRLYSQTKPITAAAAVLLASRGQLDISAPLSDYMPEFGNAYVNINGERRPPKRQIAVRDLLNMTSGLSYPDDRDEGGRQSGKMFDEIAKRLYTDDPVTTEEFGRMAAKLDLCYDPGDAFRYSINADVMGALIEKITGMKFGEFLRKEFFEPLEMKDTDFYVPSEKADRLAKTYDYDYSQNRLVECRTDHLGLRYDRDVPPAFESGGAGLCSTLDDYANFGRMLIDMGSFKGRRILSPAAVRFMTKGGLTKDIMPELCGAWDWMSGYTYGNFMRVCEDEENASVFASKGEYGWDGFLGMFFSNEPKHGITYIFGVQHFCMGRTPTLARKMKNIIMDELT